MFTEQDNEELTRVGPGTLMGDLMRRYWMPSSCRRTCRAPIARRCARACSART